MNEFLAPLWDERVVRLRLGIAPVDALGSAGVLSGLGVHLEYVPRPHPLPGGEPDDTVGLPGVRRGPSGRFAISFGVRPAAPRPRLAVRIVDAQRRYVPRRLSIPVPALAAVEAADSGGGQPPARACLPVLFPGAAYGVAAGVTAVLGRATWGSGGPPASWVRVEARVTAGGQIVRWRAHGDERGEFLLVIGPLPRAVALQKVGTVNIEVVVYGRPFPPPDDPVDSPTGSRADPLWHLPVEPVGILDPADPVTIGAVLPSGYTAARSRMLTCRRGGLTRPAPFVLT